MGHREVVDLKILLCVIVEWADDVLKKDKLVQYHLHIKNQKDDLEIYSSIDWKPVKLTEERVDLVTGVSSADNLAAIFGILCIRPNREGCKPHTKQSLAML